MMFDWAREVAAAFALFNSPSRYFALKQMTKQRRRHRLCNISIASEWLCSEDSLADRGSALQLCGGAFVLVRLTSAYAVSGVCILNAVVSVQACEEEYQEGRVQRAHSSDVLAQVRQNKSCTTIVIGCT